MIFNSLDFALFLPVMFMLYWFATNHSLRLQNLLIVFGSYFFYGWWDWRFLSLIFFSTILDYCIGIGLGKYEKQGLRKALVLLSLFVNLGFLGVFKYYNFFIENFADAFTFWGSTLSVNRLNVILPVGISFYTFQTLSYSLDVYKKNITPTRDFVAFSAFVSFFPQLVAGPIERASNLLPQFQSKRYFIYHEAVDGMRQILWGLFKKVVIADNSAQMVNAIFSNYESSSGIELILGSIFFAFQIYCDFSGYSDIAIGVAKLFGFSLMQNFAFPYFSRDIAEFWRKWHISLTTWFRDYLYIPLGGSKGGRIMNIRNIFIIFLVSGFWHGANWTFIIWGGLNAVFFLPLMVLKRNRKNLDHVAAGHVFPSFSELFHMIITFGLVCITWVFFRSNTVFDGFNYIIKMVTNNFFEISTIPDLRIMLETLLFISIMLIIEWVARGSKYGLEKWNQIPRKYQWVFYLVLCFVIFWFQGEKQEFIYFQF